MFLFFLRKTPLKPYYRSSSSSSLISITSRFLSSESNQHHKHDDPDPDKRTTTASSYDDLITVAGRSKDFTTIEHLLNKRNKDRCFNTANTFKFVTEENPNSILEPLTETLSRLNKGFTRKNAFDSLIARLCKTNHIEESKWVISKMIEGHWGINACTFHPLVSYFTRKRRFDDAWSIVAMMKDNEVSVDVGSYNYILRAHCVDGNLSVATEVLKKMKEEEGLEEDGRTYDAMVLGECKVGNVERALEILREMVEAKITVPYSTHLHVIDGLMRLGFIEQAVQFVLDVGGRDKGLDIENFGYLLSLLVKRRKLKESKLVFEEMEKRGLVVRKKLRAQYESLLLSSHNNDS